MNSNDDYKERLIIRAHIAKQVLQEAQETYAKVESDLIQELVISEQDQAMTYEDGRELIVKVVSPERVRFDQDGIRKELGGNAFLLLSKVTLDNTKVKDALVAGTVDPLIIEKYTETYHTKPYLLFSQGDIVDRD